MPKYFSKNGMDLYKNRINDLEAKLADLQSQVQYACEVGGDVWHDNFTYESLTCQIRMYDAELKSKYSEISDAVVIEYPKAVDKVCMGTAVNIEIDGEIKYYEVVGFGESDTDLNKISYSTPLAQAIMNLKPNDEVKRKIGNALKNIKILDVSPL